MISIAIILVNIVCLSGCKAMYSYSYDMAFSLICIFRKLDQETKLHYS